jgi:hypothetical protein
MSAVFDHLAVSAETLAAGGAHVEALLGVALEPGGAHPAFGTHNRLLSLGPRAYLEVIAVDPDAPPPDRPRWFDLDRFSGPPRLTNWIVRVDDLAAAQAAGAAPGAILDLERGRYRWRMAVPEDGVLPHDNLHPAVIEWRGPHPAEALPDRGCRLARLILRHPEPERLAGLPGADDGRVRIEAGPAGLSALIDTPRGARWL